MKISVVTKCAVAGALVSWLPFSGLAQSVQSSPYVLMGNGNMVHVFPTPAVKDTLPEVNSFAGVGVLSYHGGPVMTGMTAYAIFWLPSHLQDGSPTGMSAKYQPVLKQFLADYPAHGIENNSTQYYSGTTIKTYIKNVGAFGGFYVDTDAYPASGCTNPITGKNCINDAQLQAEIKRVMALKGWKTGLGNMFLVFTSSGEGSCLDANVCAYIYYCAYHGAFGSATSPTIYGNEPYADPNYCFAGGQQAPNGDVHADLAANIASHEMTEANTDPELNAWWNSANGEEIGDLCVWMFGTLTWDSGHANQMWNGHFYHLQMEYDNHTASCIQDGP